ncbi:MAG: CDP-alcohol phosphatidyltransferase family protein [Pseudomonadota bacterium]
MLDTHCRRWYRKIFTDPVVNFLVKYRFHPNLLSFIACGFGLLIIPLLYFDYNWIAVLALIISGYLDTLDGAMARAMRQVSTQGAVIDIVGDRLVELSVVIALFLVNPPGRGLWCVLLLGSILLCVTSFLVVSIFITNSNDKAQQKIAKSFNYSPGLIERAEAFIFFILMIILPSLFTFFALIFIILVSYTALLRVVEFCRSQKPVCEDL